MMRGKQMPCANGIWSVGDIACLVGVLSGLVDVAGDLRNCGAARRLEVTFVFASNFPKRGSLISVRRAGLGLSCFSTFFPAGADLAVAADTELFAGGIR